MKKTKNILPFGTWRSALQAGQLAAGSVRLGHLQVAGGAVWWSESRPADGGRSAVVRCALADGTPEDISPPGFDARSRVHEYGGAAFVVGEDGSVWASNDVDRRIHRLRPPRDDAPWRDGPAVLGRERCRYADFALDAARGLLIAVREHHAEAGPGREPVNEIVAIDLASGREHALAGGHDFCSSPTVSPDGRTLAWLTWDHPRMPWTGTDLWTGTLGAREPRGPALTALTDVTHVAGGPDEAVIQPRWSPRGVLHYASDRSGWWNLYRVPPAPPSAPSASSTPSTSSDPEATRHEPLWPMRAEFARPPWNFGQSMYDFDHADPAGEAIVCAVIEAGRTRLARLAAPVDGSPRELHVIDTPWAGFDHVQAGEGIVACFGDSPHHVSSVLAIDLASGATRVLRASSPFAFARDDVSVAEAIAFPGADGETAHAFFYAPASATHEAPPGELPPLVVMSHGGPTAMTEPGLRAGIQYYTQRGIAVVDVNYGGSTGYGRAYRQRLDGRWGEVDVGDVEGAVRHLVATGRVDPARLCIRGGSAGGYTTLAALAFRPGLFRAGASHYGIGDLATLARDTHKFEARYLDSLVGPWPAAEATYRARSPVFHVDRIASALILFQGDEDEAVPPAQSQAMYEAVKAKGLPIAYLLFKGEQHGFRQAKHIRRALEAEVAFFGRVLGFVPADALEEPLVVENAPAPVPTDTPSTQP